MPPTGEVGPGAYGQPKPLKPRSIATCYRDCERGFLNLDQLLGNCNTWDLERLATIGLQSQEQVEQVRQTLRVELLGRLKMWAGNCGAHRTGKVSLDHRLRDALHLHRQAIRLLENLEQALEEGIRSITTPIPPASTSYGHSSGAAPFYLSSAGSDTSEEYSATDETNSDVGEQTPEIISDTESISLVCTNDLEYSIRDITHVLKCLYRFSTMLHRPIAVNRIKKCASINVDEFKDSDCDYVAARFESAPEYLQQRLGRANNKRRQLLEYYERHHRKIGQRLEPAAAPVAGQLYSENPDLEHSETLSETTAHTFLDRDLHAQMNLAGTLTDDYTNPIFKHPLPDDQGSDSGRSETSYASTSASLFVTGEFRLSVPEPEHAKEHGFNDDPFQCTYCHDFIRAKDTKAWKSHVFSDLLPYVCTFGDCSTPDHLYHSRGEWFEHESQVHRREWFCEACKQIFLTKDGMITHLNDTHRNEFAKSQYSSIVKWCERAVTSKQFCPLCPKSFFPAPQHLQRFHRNDIGGDLEFTDFDALSRDMVSRTSACSYCPVKYSPIQLKRHLADHLQQLALFVLPRSMDDYEEGIDEEPDNVSQDEFSVSGLGSEDGQGSEKNVSDPDTEDEDEFVQVLKAYYEKVKLKGKQKQRS